MAALVQGGCWVTEGVGGLRRGGGWSPGVWQGSAMLTCGLPEVRDVPAHVRVEIPGLGLPCRAVHVLTGLGPTLPLVRAEQEPLLLGHA